MSIGPYAPLTNISYQWWTQEGDTAAATIHGLIRHWDTTQGAILASNVRNLRLYSNREVQSLSIAQYVLSTSQDYMTGGFVGGVFWNRPNRLTLNVVKSCVDTLVAKITKNKVKPMFLTTGGTLEQRTRAQDVNDFFFGLLQDQGGYDTLSKVFRDACIFGTGFTKPYIEEGKLCFDRVFPDEVICDPADAYYGDPSGLYQRKFISRERVAAMYPERADDIRRVKTQEYPYTGQYQDTVLAVEAWYMPKTGKAIGKHVICLDGVMLVEEDWKLNETPLRTLFYTLPLVGFFGSGVSEDLLGIQVEINRLLLHIQESMRLLSHPRIFIDMASKVNPNHIVNEIGTIIPYSGAPPIIQAAQTVHPEIFQQLESLYRKAFEIIGVSSLSAQGRKPSGLDSGAALREFSDIETERFASTVAAWEQHVLDVCRYVTKILPDSFTVSAFSKEKGLRKLRWGDIKLPDDSYLVQCFPTNALPKHPAARLEYVTELRNGGLIDSDTALDLLDYPDVQSYVDVQLSPQRLVISSIEKILDSGEYVEPEPYLPLGKAKEYGMKFYCWAKTRDYPEDRLDLVRRWIDDVANMEAMAMQQAALQAPAAATPSQAMMAQAPIAPTAPTPPLA